MCSPPFASSPLLRWAAATLVASRLASAEGGPGGPPRTPSGVTIAPTPGARPQAETADFRAYAGTDARGVPRYVTRAFTDPERLLLRTAYGVEDPNRLYLSDSSAARVLKYDTRRKRCRTCYVNSYRLGFASVRRAGESWDAVERRVRRTRPRDFGASAGRRDASLRALDPAVEPAVVRLLDGARRAGFRVRVVDTYRSPEREAYLMALGGGRTHTLTSLHSYGRAVDVEVLRDGGRRVAPRARWVAFRRWVRAYPGGAFRLIGTPAHTWDWRHVELPSPRVGFRSIEAALARGRACVAPAGDTPRPSCDFAPNLPNVR